LQRSPHKTIEILAHFQLEVNASMKWLKGNHHLTDSRKKREYRKIKGIE
jgi:hypothetical protein